MRTLAVLAVLCLGMAGCSDSAADQAAAGRAAYRQGFDALDAQDYAKAENYLTEAQRLLPDDPYVALDLGVTYQSLGEKDKARAAYERVLEIGKGVQPVRVTDPHAAGKSLADIAAANIESLAR
ncbi:MAG TPA: tetratricopeptide repeat protein [Aliidongia sp.]|nr:tetratricopeptide repeat protein [Aliidongia sp.]